MSTLEQEGTATEGRSEPSERKFGPRAAAMAVIAFFLPVPFTMLSPGWIGRGSAGEFFVAGGPLMYAVTLAFIVSWVLTGVLAVLSTTGRRFPSALIIGAPLLPVIPGAIGALIGYAQVEGATMFVSPEHLLQLLLASYSIALYPLLYGVAMAIPLLCVASLALILRLSNSWSRSRRRAAAREEGRVVRDLVAAGAGLSLAFVLIARFVDVVSVSHAFEMASMVASGLVPPFFADLKNPLAELIRLAALIAIGPVIAATLTLSLAWGFAAVLNAAKSRMAATFALASVVALPIWAIGTIRDQPLMELNSVFRVDQDLPESAAEVSLPELIGPQFPNEPSDERASDLVLKGGRAFFDGREVDVTSLAQDPRAIGVLLGGDWSRVEQGGRVRIVADRAETGTSLMALVKALGEAGGGAARLYLATKAIPPPLPAPFSAEPFVRFDQIRYWSGEDGADWSRHPPEERFPLVRHSEGSYRLRSLLPSFSEAASVEQLFQALSAGDVETVALFYGDDASVQEMIDDLAALPKGLFRRELEVIWGCHADWSSEVTMGHGDGDVPTRHPRWHQRDLGTLLETGLPPEEIVSGTPAVSGGLDVEMVERVLHANRVDPRFCFERSLQRYPDLSGRVAVQWLVDETGAVSRAIIQDTTAGNVELEECLLRRIRRWRFPEPSGGGTAAVTTHWDFAPE